MTDSTAEQRPERRVVIWARPERASKGPPASLSRTEIAAVAVALADAEGLESVSMRKVAAALGVGAASLYGYMSNKDELADLMVDLVEGEDGAPPALTGDPRVDLTALAHRIRHSILRHPWMASVAAGRPHFGPNSLRWTEHGLAALDPLLTTADEMLLISELLQAFVRGFATREVAEEQALKRGGISAEEWTRSLAPYIKAVVGSGEYPRFSRIVRDADLPHADHSRELIFSTALSKVLDSVLAPARE
jgi:AcrR family transcriptional regulator